MSLSRTVNGILCAASCNHRTRKGKAATATIAIYAIHENLFALAQDWLRQHIGQAFQASSPKNFHRPALSGLAFFSLA
jgi:hypothetical protein